MFNGPENLHRKNQTTNTQRSKKSPDFPDCDILIDKRTDDTFRVAKLSKMFTLRKVEKVNGVYLSKKMFEFFIQLLLNN